MTTTSILDPRTAARRLIESINHNNNATAQSFLRDALISFPDRLDYDEHYNEFRFSDESELTPELANQINDALDFLMNDEYSKHFISETCLSLSLCPMHRLDYAICFDDDDDECAIIREYFPDHDT